MSAEARDITPHEALIAFAGEADHPLDALALESDGALRVLYRQARTYRALLHSALDVLFETRSSEQKKGARVLELIDENRELRRILRKRGPDIDVSGLTFRVPFDDGAVSKLQNLRGGQLVPFRSAEQEK